MNRASTTQLVILSVYAVSMALLEAAVVVYMRRLYYPDQQLDLFPLDFLLQYDPRLELAREAATVFMIVSVALLAERRSWTRGFAAFVFVFGLWDLFYYLWLKVLIDWPRTWFEWDVLFLIPVIWLGPWICPALIAMLFVLWGGYVFRSERNFELTKSGFLLFVIGALIGMGTFFQPVMAEWMRGGMDALVRYMPGSFWWWLFIPSYLMMAAGLATAFVSGGSETSIDKEPAA